MRVPVKSIEKCWIVLSLIYFCDAILPFVFGLQPGSRTGEEFNPFLLAIEVAIYLVLLLCILPSLRTFLRLCGEIKWVLLLSILAVGSILWSGDPLLTLKRGVTLALTAAFGVYFAVRFTVREQVRLLCAAMAIIIALTVMVVMCFPEYGIMQGDYAGAWKGGFIHKNGLGRAMTLACVLFFVAAYFHFVRTRLAWFGLAAAMGLLWLSESKTALVVLVVALASFWLLKFLQRPTKVAFPVLVAVSLFLTGLVLAFVNRAEAFTLLNRDSTMSGRTELWQSVLQAIAIHPWLGYGFAAFWRGVAGPSAQMMKSLHWDVPHSHNGILDLWLDLGIAGVALFAGSFISAWRGALRALRLGDAAMLWPLTFLVLIAFSNLTESVMLRPNSLFWALYVAVVTTVQHEVRREQPNHPSYAQCSDVSDR